MYTYKTTGTCAREIQFDIVDNKVHNVHFVGGCMGNTQGVAILSEGREVDELIHLLKGVDCGGRGTSCPDQFALALMAYKKQVQ